MIVKLIEVLTLLYNHWTINAFYKFVFKMSRQQVQYWEHIAAAAAAAAACLL